ncbi:ABC transporter permease [Weissella paramesenteroides]
MSKINLNTLRELKSSKARFFSVTLLLALAVFIFAGLKATTPDMNQTMRSEYDKTNLADAQLNNSLGFTGSEIESIQKNKNIKSVSKSFQTIAVTSNNKHAINIISNPEKLSKFTITKGREPKKDNEIILGEQLRGDYNIGQQIKIKHNDDLKQKQYKIVGFATSSVYMKKSNLGQTNLGDGQIDAFAGVKKATFTRSDPNILQVQFKNLSGDAYQDKYEYALRHKVSLLQSKLNDLSQQRRNELLSSVDDKINQAHAAQTALLKQKILTSNGATLQALNHKQADLKAQINQAEVQKDTINQLKYTVQSRGQFSVGYSDMGSDADRITGLSNTFPIFFFTVALMVSFTVMRRMVEEKRVEIGTLKALGYSNNKIASEYYLYASLTSVVGTIIGAGLGLFILPKVIFNSFAANYVLNDVHLTWQTTPILVSFALTLLSTVFAVFLAIRPLFAQQTTALMLPKAPTASKKILLEHITWFWNKLSFSRKVTARNIFRYKGRMWMTILGVAGSTAMLITGFGMQQSLNKMIPTQYGEITHYQLLGVFNNNANNAADYGKMVRRDKNISDSKPAYFQNVTVAVPHIQDLQSVPMIVTNNDNLSTFIDLKSKNNKKISLKQDGITISSKLAKIQNLSFGGHFTIKDAQQNKHRVKIANITKNYTGHAIYMSQAYYKKIFKKEYSTNAYLIKLNNNQQAEQVSRRLNNVTSSITVINSDDTKETINSILKSLNRVVWVIVVVSAILAFIVLYTLTNINVSERIRELSTIKVLGFYPKEVLAYIYRETIILTFAGLVIGFISGIFVHAYLMTIITPENVLSVPGISWQIFGIAMLLIILFTGLVAILMKKKIDAVDMLEALKSVD